MNDEIDRRIEAGLTAIRQSAAKGSSDEVSLFVSHHLSEVGEEYWQRRLGDSPPTPDSVLALLELRSHWSEADEDGIDVFDFTLPGGVTDYVISVSFDESGQVEGLAMES